MPLSSSRSVSNKNRQKGRSQRKTTKMQASNVKDEPFLWTEPLWDRLQFQPEANKLFGRVKKLTKTVARNFPRFGFRTGPFLHPFQTRRNAQGGQEHKHEEDYSKQKRYPPLRCYFATTRSFSTPRTTSSHVLIGNGRAAAISKRCKKDARKGEEALLGTDSEESQEIVLLRTAQHQIRKLNLQAVTGLQNLSLIDKDARNKTNWEITEEVRALVGDVVGSVEVILLQLSDGLVSAKSSVIRNHDATRSTEKVQHSALVEYLRRSLNDLHQSVSEHFFQAIMLLAGSLHESIQTPDCVQASLQSLAFECIHLQDRLISAEQNMVNGIHGRTLMIENADQEKKRTDSGLKLMEVASSNVIDLQHKLLQTCFVDQRENEASLKETENLDLYLQLSWSWLQELQKSIAILYPEKERCLYDCFMDTLVLVLEGIVKHLNEVHEKDTRGVEDVLFDDDLFCEKWVIASLTHLYNIFDEAVRRIDQNLALEITDFVQIQDFCDLFVSLLTVLCCQLTSTSVSTEAEHHSLTRSTLECEIKVLRLAEDYLQSILYNIHKDTRASKAVTKMVGELTQNVKYSEMMLLSDEDTLVEDGHSPSSSQAAYNEQANVEIEPPISPDISNPGEASSENIKNLKGNVRFPTPFANPRNHPDVLESIEDLSANTDEEQAPTDGSNYDLVHAEETLLLNDASLDLSLGSLPSSGFFTRVDIDRVTEMKYLDQGSSGYVTLRKLGNRPVVVKESKCPDPIKTLKRLNREAKLHQKINTHPNIVRFLGGWAKSDEHGEDQIGGIITEWCDLGDLCDAIKQAAWLQELDRDGKDNSRMKHLVGYRLYKDWNKRLELVVDIATAMVYMHNCYVVHRDLTCKNVLLYTVDKSGEFGAKVCDFERARYLPGGEDVPRTNSCANSAPWMGPEVLRNEFYGLKADVYSIGTILWSLMYLQNPWTHLKERTGAHVTVIQHLLTTGKLSLSISEDHAPEEVPVFPQLISLVKSAWQADPDKRPTMTEFICRLKQIINCMNST